jgi:hypothetical protein
MHGSGLWGRELAGLAVALRLRLVAAPAPRFEVAVRSRALAHASVFDRRHLHQLFKQPTRKTTA